MSKNEGRQVRGLNTHGKQTKRMKKEALPAEETHSLKGSRNQLTKSTNNGPKSTKLSSIHYEGGQEHSYAHSVFHHARGPSNGKSSFAGQQ